MADWSRIKKGVAVTSGVTEAFTNSTLGKFAFTEHEGVSCLGTWTLKSAVQFGNSNRANINEAISLLGGLTDETPYVEPSSMYKTIKTTHILDITLTSSKTTETETAKFAATYLEEDGDYVQLKLTYVTLDEKNKWLRNELPSGEVFTVTGGNDINDENFYAFLTRYFNKTA